MFDEVAVLTFRRAISARFSGISKAVSGTAVSAAFAVAALFAADLANAATPHAADHAQTDEAGLATLWEALWHQSGTPTRLVRWEQPVRWRLSGRNLPEHREMVLRALEAVSQETGIPFTEANAGAGDPDRADAPAAPNLRIEIVANTALENRQPCVTTLDFRTETQIDSALVQMRERDVFRCAHHEAMHVMGVRGHPAGKTVLSYFPVKVDSLLPLDRALLRAWYSPRMRPGMTPFEALPVLAQEWLALQPDPQAAAAVRDRFFADTVAAMRAYAEGTGDIPAIIRRSGKATAEGVRLGRSEMGYFLGVAYLEGATVGTPDRESALLWLERSARIGNRTALARLAGMR